jgi:ornithine--oxo-acid transaminase
MQQQCSRLTLVSRAFHSDRFGPYAEELCETMGYDRVLPMNTGVETGETALKLARRWAYDVKGVLENQALMLFAKGNFWGRTLAAISSSDDPSSTGGFGPLLPGYLSVPYNDLAALEAALQQHGPRLAAFMVEPIQGEAGVVVPDEGYLARAQALCRAHNVLLIADEVQTGLGRTGKLLCSDWDSVRPDILLLGKALSGGMLPVSAVLSSHAIMSCIKAGQHGSTYGGNPLACAVAQEALRVTVQEALPENAQARGTELRAALSSLAADFPGIFVPAAQAVRGKGLLNALLCRQDAQDAMGRSLSAWQLCLAFKDAGRLYGLPQGLLAKPTHNTIIRLAPPLVISQQQTRELVHIMATVLERVAAGDRRGECGAEEAGSH